MSLQKARDRYPGAETFSFGDDPVLIAEIHALIRAGRKTVTCNALVHFESGKDAMPTPGRVDIALNPDGSPALAIRTLEVLHRPFERMTEDLVAEMGEFPDVTTWQRIYRDHLTRAGLFAPDVMMLVERFELVEDFGGDDV